ncbi:MAG TPA: GGDEF domain-containing protein [Gammaproteobacteria bacterium]|nr:GGDEF domain-containing protein [Gammaproteobacteria bacterium]
MHKNQTISITPRALHLLQALKTSRTGAAIYEHVQDMLEAFEHGTRQTQLAYLELIQALLEELSRHLPPEAPQLIHLKLVKMRLAMPLSPGEIRAIAEQIRRLSLELDEEITLPSPSLEAEDQETAPATPARPEPSPRQEPAPAATAPSASRVETAMDTSPEGRETGVEPETTPPPEAAGEERPAETLSLQEAPPLAEKRQRIRKIQQTLVGHLADVVKQNEKFGLLLEVEHESLRQTDNIEEMGALKEALIKEISKLMEGHQELTRKLESASKYLEIIESEGQYLNDELTRVHILSLTDELTELPNRRAFMRRLEDEVARVQRYGYPLSLALLDMDGFKKINDTYGHAAGDEVLRNFASNILSIFRHHDMVARYGGEEFAVILPNTDQHGALRALQKVQKRASESPYQFNGETRPMPTFSAGIALYRPGETPGSLIERADKALYQAKRLGRNRIELADNGDSVEATAP